MANDSSKGFHPFKWMWENFDKLAIGGTMLAAVITGRMSDDAPDTAKKAFKATGGSLGGKGDPLDEAKLLKLIDMIKPTAGYSDKPELQSYLNRGLGEVFKLQHKKIWLQEAGIEAFEEWRRILVQLYLLDPDIAVDYLTSLAKDYRSAYQSELRKKGVPVSTLSKAVKNGCWKRACETVATKMRNNSIIIPNGKAVPAFERMKEAAKKVSPVAIEKLKAARGFSWKVLKTGWFAGTLAGQKGLHWLDEKDQAFAKYTATLHKNRTSRLSWWGAYKLNRESGLNRRSSARKTPGVSRKSRKGPWKQRSFRLAHALNILNWIR
jgi:hypothetical protein